MSERRTRSQSKNRTIAYVAAGLVHALIIAALLVNFTSDPEPIDAAFAEKVDVVKATTVDESEIKRQQDKLKQEDREKQRKKELERKRLEQLKKDTAQEQKKIEDLKKKQKLEQDRAVELENQRKAIALKKQQEEEKRRLEKIEQQRKDKLAADKRERERLEREELERIKREEQELLAQQQMNQLLAQEEAFLAEQRAKERATTLLAKYTALITEKVKRYRTISPDFERWRTTTMNVKLSSSGAVQSVRIVKSSGSDRYDRSVETAIYQASPLPIPAAADDPGVNREFQNLNISFDMSGL